MVMTQKRQQDQTTVLVSTSSHCLTQNQLLKTIDPMTRQSKFMKQTLFKHFFKKGFLLTRKVHPDRIWKLPWRRLPSRLPRRRLSPKMRSAAPSSRLPDTNLSCNASQFYTLFGWFAPERTIRRVHRPGH